MTENPSQDAVDEALREIDGLAESIGDQPIGTVRNETGDGDTIITRQIERSAGDRYSVVASPTFRYVALQTSFDAAETLAATEARANAGENVQQVQVSEEAIQTARRELRDRISEDQHGAIRATLVNRTGTDDFVVQLMPQNQVFVTGFTVEDRLFVYDRDITVTEFYDEVQSLHNTLWRGTEYIWDAYDLREAVAESQEGPRGYA